MVANARTTAEAEEVRIVSSAMILVRAIVAGVHEWIHHKSVCAALVVTAVIYAFRLSASVRPLSSRSRA